MGYVKLKKWAEAEEDCSAALGINAKNTKAKYRRAMARYELGKDKEALQDVDEVLKELPDPSSNKEAVALKDQIKARLEKASKPSGPPAGFKRMQIVEEDESDEEPTPSKPVSPPSAKDKAVPAKASEPPAGFKRMQIVEEDESDDEV